MIEVVVKIEERQKDNVMIETNFDADDWEYTETEVDAANRIANAVCCYIDACNEASAKDDAKSILSNIGRPQ